MIPFHNFLVDLKLNINSLNINGIFLCNQMAQNGRSENTNSILGVGESLNGKVDVCLPFSSVEHFVCIIQSKQFDSVRKVGLP